MTGGADDPATGGGPEKTSWAFLPGDARDGDGACIGGGGGGGGAICCPTAAEDGSGVTAKTGGDGIMDGSGAGAAGVGAAGCCC